MQQKQGNDQEETGPKEQQAHQPESHREVGFPLLLPGGLARGC